MKYMYTFVRHEDEQELCDLELRSLLGSDSVKGGGVASYTADNPIAVNRSPFIKRRICAAFEAQTIDELATMLALYELDEQTFKVLYTDGDERHTYEERRQLERAVGSALRGRANMADPQLKFGLMRYRNRWLFGPCEDNDAVWHKHQRKPQNYSTALPVRAARALVNIAVGPNPDGVSLIDPCCGMGTVLIEALSMGIGIQGVDINPLAVRGARANLAFYGYPDAVRLGDIRLLNGRYDAAIVDMPYNLCSVLPAAEQSEMLDAIRRIAKRAVIVTTESITERLLAAGFRLVDSAELRKASFTRYASVVE